MSTYAKAPGKKSLERHLYRNTPELWVMTSYFVENVFFKVAIFWAFEQRENKELQYIFLIKNIRYWILDKCKNAGRVNTSKL